MTSKNLVATTRRSARQDGRSEPTKGTKSVWQLIHSDLDRYRVTDKRSLLGMLVVCPGSIAGILYRLSHWVWTYSGVLAPLIFLLRPVFVVLWRLSEMLNGISIRPQAVIGEGLYINHGSSIYVTGRAVIGSNCNLSHEVTLGVAGRDSERGAPVLGDRVFVAPGAKLIGPVEVGNDVAIGANAVVTRSLPDRAVAVGIPAKVISYKGSFEFILYRGMQDDEARSESFASREVQEQGG